MVDEPAQRAASEAVDNEAVDLLAVLVREEADIPAEVVVKAVPKVVTMPHNVTTNRKEVPTRVDQDVVNTMAIVPCPDSGKNHHPKHPAADAVDVMVIVVVMVATLTHFSGAKATSFSHRTGVRCVTLSHSVK